VPIKSIIGAATDEREFSHTTVKALSILFLSVSAVLSLLSYTGKRFYVFDHDYSITPDFISGVVALCLIIPLYARGILRWSSSVYGVLMFFLFLMVYAALAKLALLGAGKIGIYLVTASILLSWLGMRAVAGFGWILAFAAAVISALATSEAMGLNGFLFIASAFLGLIMHSNLSPSRLVDEILNEYSRVGKGPASSVKADILRARKRLD
jgi:hypothetical protein